jgi:hypothetical protein
MGVGRAGLSGYLCVGRSADDRPAGRDPAALIAKLPRHPGAMRRAVAGFVLGYLLS